MSPGRVSLGILSPFVFCYSVLWVYSGHSSCRTALFWSSSQIGYGIRMGALRTGEAPGRVRSQAMGFAFLEAGKRDRSKGNHALQKSYYQRSAHLLHPASLEDGFGRLVSGFSTSPSHTRNNVALHLTASRRGKLLRKTKEEHIPTYTATAGRSSNFHIMRMSLYLSCFRTSPLLDTPDQYV